MNMHCSVAVLQRQMAVRVGASISKFDGQAWSLRHMSTVIQCSIHGRVQGVGFRAWTVKTAKKLGLTGWVRNCDDGTVEAVFCGEEEAVEAMIAQCQHGPLAAKVTQVERKLADIPPPADFTQRRD